MACTHLQGILLSKGFLLLRVKFVFGQPSCYNLATSVMHIPTQFNNLPPENQFI